MFPLSVDTYNGPDYMDGVGSNQASDPSPRLT